MYIKTISIKNFRLLKDSIIELNPDKKQDLSLLIGKNNTGKTSFIVLFDKFFRNEHYKFNFNDFPTSLRKEIRKIKPETDLAPCLIQMKIDIVYSNDDNLEYLSDFILDLNPDENIVRLFFECEIDKERLLEDLSTIDDKHKNQFIEKNLGDYLSNKYFVYNDEEDLKLENRTRLVEKKISDIKKVINYQVIHAKRNVSSSEYSGNGKTALSELATEYFNKDNLFSREAFGSINDTILEMDETLNRTYEEHFKDYFDNVKQFVNGKLNVVSNLESKQILSNYSKVVYGDSSNYLPETLNGLGHLNILFLLLQIEVKKKFFEQEKKDINLLFIEEPEAHTHPQMQYIFAKRIKEVLKAIPNIQTFITSHSSHIVSQCEFDDIRYFKVVDDNAVIKNFHKELETRYESEPEHFKFLKQYLTLYSSELFFAEKIIFIEGVSEKLLLPFFIKQYDESRKGEENYIPLTSQNISYIEAGANAKVFRHFIEFLDIKTLIFTDLDGCEIKSGENDKKYWGACKTTDSINTTNVTIKYFFNAPVLPEIKERESKEEELKKFDHWYENIKQNSLSTINTNIYVSYQINENLYHPRSFEDAFFSMNLSLVIDNIAELNGLKNKSKITSERTDFYELTQQSLKEDGKSSFASSLLYLALTKDVKWNSPKYITEGLKWISE